MSDFSFVPLRPFFCLPLRSVRKSNFDKGLHNLTRLIQERHILMELLYYIYVYIYILIYEYLYKYNTAVLIKICRFESTLLNLRKPL